MNGKNEWLTNWGADPDLCLLKGHSGFREGKLCNLTLALANIYLVSLYFLETIISTEEFINAFISEAILGPRSLFIRVPSSNFVYMLYFPTFICLLGISRNMSNNKIQRSFENSNCSSCNLLIRDMICVAGFRLYNNCDQELAPISTGKELL